MALELSLYEQIRIGTVDTRPRSRDRYVKVSPSMVQI